jgi:hypothetical protein
MAAFTRDILRLRIRVPYLKRSIYSPFAIWFIWFVVCERVHYLIAI